MEDLSLIAGMGDLGMELQSPEVLGRIMDRSEGSVLSMGDRFKSLTTFGDPVAMAHPDLKLFRAISEDGVI